MQRTPAKIVRLGALVTLLACMAAETQAQRGRARGRGQPQAPATPPPAPEPKEPASVERWTAIVGGEVHVGDGRVLRGGTVLIGDDKVHAVGHDLEIPAGATVLRADGKVVTPGYVAVRAQGIGLPASVTGELKDAANPFDPAIKRALAAGITSYLYWSGSGQATPGGTTALVKLAWGDLAGMVRQGQCAYSMRTPLSATEWRRLRELVGQAKEHKAKTEAAAAAPSPAPAATPGRGGGPPGERGRGAPGQRPSPSAPPAGTAELLRIMRGEARLWVNPSATPTDGGRGRGGGSDDRDGIRQALQIAELLGVGIVLDDPVTAWCLADQIAATGSLVVLNPRNTTPPDPTDPEQTGANIAAARILDEAGVPVAVTCPSGRFGGAQVGTGGIMGSDLNTPQVDAAFAVRGGMDPRRALRSLTLDAARAAGVERIVGSLEPGKDADVLILDGDPLSYRTFVETALVNGKVVYEKDKEPYYQHLNR
ncbi:MAG TPA: amidohydrolase family protein [Planctomycetota bacterium]|nr:amidohydrolase family protein [Planctomycetota bacterium]